MHTLGFQKLVPVGVQRACVLTDRDWGLVGENARPAVFPFDVKVSEVGPVIRLAVVVLLFGACRLRILIRVQLTVPFLNRCRPPNLHNTLLA